MKIWKLILGFFGLVGGLFAVNAVKPPIVFAVVVL